MTLPFFIALALALLAGYIAYQSQEEIVKAFSVIVMAISLLISFAWAPLLMQILILVVSLAVTRYLCDRRACHDVSKFH